VVKGIMKNLLSSVDLSRKDIDELFKICGMVVSGKRRLSVKKNSTLALFFAEPSTRTMVSFEVAASRLGCGSVYIDARTSQASRGEELADTARILSIYCDFIAVRINDHDQLLAMAKSSRVPVINALTSLEHPTQALADCYTIFERKGNLSKLRIAFIGDTSQNTANSLMLTAAKLGASISLVGPKSCKPNPFYLKESRKYSKVDVYDSIEEGLEGADVVYTDTFVSMGDEAEARKRTKMFAPYQLNSKALSFAKSNSIVMHPLPAHRGVEITGDVIDGKRSVVWQQAKNKMIIEEAILLYLSI
jgi:ornithine carbamoyltransferase